VKRGSKTEMGPDEAQKRVVTQQDMGLKTESTDALPLPRIAGRKSFTPKERKVRMERFAVAFQATFGNVTQACIAADISLPTYYLWRQRYPEFKEMIDGLNVDDVFVDWVETRLMSKIKAGDTASIIFALKTKGRKRGWEEKLPEQNNQPQVVFNLVMPEQQGKADVLSKKIHSQFQELEAEMMQDLPERVDDVYGVEPEEGQPDEQ
jgi:hypothetical protein